MKRDFLTELAEWVLQKHGNQLDKVTILFPNRRAGLFFTKALAGFIKKPVWSPGIISIEDFVNGFSNNTVADHLTLLLDLYEVFKDKTGKEESFDQFYFWGEMLLRDFDEVDRNLVNANHIFTAIKNLKEIDAEFRFFSDEQKDALKKFWGITLSNDSTHSKNFIWFWQQLMGIYTEFNTRLSKNKYAYQGSLYKELCNKIDNKNLSWDKGVLIFAGFNALTTSEEKIIKHFIVENKAEIYWDLDNYYFDDKNQEAGYFFRKHFEDPVLRNTMNAQGKDFFRKGEKSIRTVAAPQYIEQVKIAGAVIEELSGEGKAFEPERTVIVLPDESLLPNLLFSLPDSVEKVNITMGYPLRNASFYSLLDNLLGLFERRRPGKNGGWCNYQAVLNILNHPFIQGISKNIASDLIRRIEKSNMIYVPESMLSEHPAFKELFRVVKDYNDDIFKVIRAFLVFIRTTLEQDGLFDAGFEREFSIVLYKLISRLEDTFHTRNIGIDHTFLRKLLKYFSNSEKIPFSGEPLEGLQIMGLLETRNLDFDHVIMLCVNEGTLPGSSSQNTFIPYNVRKAYGLLNPDSRDAIYAYLFYRLIQRARDITLIYNAEESYSRNAEPSRYIYQLKFESGFEIKEFSIQSHVEIVDIEPVVLHKNGFITGRLNRFISGFAEKERHLTASALNLYLSCPLSFGYKYVFDIREKEEVTEDLDAATFGNILHKVMERAYTDYIGHTVEKNDIDAVYTKIDQYIETAFKETYGDEDVGEFKFEGRNIIGREVIRKYILKILEKDKSDAPFKLTGLEKKLFTTVSVMINGKVHEIALKGYIDRIDVKDGSLRIIDYKTGKDQSVFPDVAGLFDVTKNNRNKAVFQMMLYAWMYIKTEPDMDMPVITGLYNARELFSKDFDMRVKVKPGRTPAVPVSDIREFMPEFENLLGELIREIFDPNIPFAHYDHLDKCIYCKYTGLPSEFS